MNPLIAEDFLLDEIRKEQVRSEKNISLVQLTFISLITLTWIALPKASGTASQIPFTPIVIACYFLFVLCRVYWAQKNLVNDAVVFISIFFDIFMLTLFIAAVSYQYGMGIDFSLQVPAFSYYFIFIALRAFRHEARYVLWTGLLSSLSWASLTAFVYYQPEIQITRNFAEYGMNGKLLVGAEVEKIIILMIYTVILASVVLNGRRLLINSVRQFRISRSLSLFFSPDVADQISSAKELIRAGKGHLRSAAILSIDIRGFSKISSESSPSQLIQLLNEYQSIVIKVVHNHRGSVDKFMGDGILCHFGASKPSSTYAADCLRCIDELQSAIHDWNKKRVAQGDSQIFLGCSMAVGQVVFGAIGDQNRMEFTTIGEAVNIASKIEKLNKPLKSCALATKKAHESGMQQGYISETRLESSTQIVEGLPYKTLDLVILHREAKHLNVPETIQKAS